MSWRRFCALLGGLGPNSAYVTVRSQRDGPGAGGHERLIEDAQEAERHVERLLG